jgi:O-acetyl-ADP-ribose deacetylase (regulator of RNase III)
MITHKYNSNITEVTQGVIVHGCNAQGVMGSGVAKQLRAKYPEIYVDYLDGLEEYSTENLSPLGAVFLSEVRPTLVIANAITQEFYGKDGRKYISYTALEEALGFVQKVAMASNVVVHIPYLIGAGLGGGDEKTILEIVEKTMYNTDCILHHFNK